MISDRATVLCLVLLAVILLFFIWSLKKRQRMHTLHKLYLVLTGIYAVWLLALLGMRITAPDNTPMLFFLDCITQIGGCCAVLYLCIAIVFTGGHESLPRRCRWLFVIPAATVLVGFTNPWHHLLYVNFSIIKSEIVFGPFVAISGVYVFLCTINSVMMMVNFARKNTSKLYRKQCALFALGGMFPLAVSMYATFSKADIPITATPISFIPTILFNGIAIYQLHLLDIMPVATQRVLDWISDCYLILNEKGLVISYNKPFAKVFGSQFGIVENRFLEDCIKEDDVTRKTAIYNMISAVDACRESHVTISYEQTAIAVRDGVAQKSYYVTDISPLDISGKSVGFIIIFKDVTQLKKSMQRLQENEAHMLAQERFAFLGQMMGGLAHNLKTPIMSISGCISAADGLIDECLASLDDPVVNSDDFREIYGEIRGWFQKIQESSAYMSDIITTIKGQAASAGATDEFRFTPDELVKRTTLLMRHELHSGGCTLVTECNISENQTLQGDINNLVQVLGNLISNAIYAQKQVGGGTITLGIIEETDALKIYIKDTGPGILPSVRERLFQQMVTSKGTQGSGLGLYISNIVVRGKFGGSMWAEDNPGGGAIIGMTIPTGAPKILSHHIKESGAL